MSTRPRANTSICARCNCRIVRHRRLPTGRAALTAGGAAGGWKRGPTPIGVGTGAAADADTTHTNAVAIAPRSARCMTAPFLTAPSAGAHARALRFPEGSTVTTQKRKRSQLFAGRAGGRRFGEAERRESGHDGGAPDHPADTIETVDAASAGRPTMVRFSIGRIYADWPSLDYRSGWT